MSASYENVVLLAQAAGAANATTVIGTVPGAKKWIVTRIIAATKTAPTGTVSVVAELRVNGFAHMAWRYFGSGTIASALAEPVWGVLEGVVLAATQNVQLVLPTAWTMDASVYGIEVDA